MLKFLNHPYPFYENTWQGLKICLSIGIFIAAFCFLFQPFGLERVSSLGQLGYGMVSFLVCAIFIVVLPLIFNSALTTKEWKIYKEIIWVLVITISLATANYFYSGYAFQVGYAFDLDSYLLVLLYTCLIAVIPTIAIILYKQLFEYKKVVEEVEKIDSKLISNSKYLKSNSSLMNISSESDKENIELSEEDFLVLASSGNYVEIYFIKNGGTKKKLLRNNISKIDKQLKKNPNLIRCHRSYLVNLNKVSHITGNLQGYQLFIDNLDWQVPVSRSFTKLIKSRILG